MHKKKKENIYIRGSLQWYFSISLTNTCTMDEKYEYFDFYKIISYRLQES